MPGRRHKAPIYHTQTLSDLFLLPPSPARRYGSGQFKNRGIYDSALCSRVPGAPRTCGTGTVTPPAQFKDRQVGYLAILYQGPSVCLHTPACLSVCLVQLKAEQENRVKLLS